MDGHLDEAIAKLARIDREKVLHSDTLLRLMVLFRLHLEENHLKAQYPTTMLYCNWCVHPSLDRSGQEVLEDVLTAMLGSPYEFSDAINRALSFHTLRSELDQILASAGAQSRLLSSLDGWTTFISVLVYLLRNHPLEWHRNPKTQPPTGDYPGTLQIVTKGPGTIHMESGPTFELDRPTAFWLVDVLPRGHKLMGWLSVIEPPQHFDN